MDQPFRPERIAGRVAADIRRGRDPEEITTELTEQGATREQAEALVGRIAASVRPAQAATATAGAEKEGVTVTATRSCSATTA